MTEYDILVAGRNASVVEYLAKTISHLANNPVEKVFTLGGLLDTETQPFLIFLSSELVQIRDEDQQSLVFELIIRSLPNANLIVFGEDSISMNLAYVSMGARDFLTNEMLTSPRIEKYLKKRLRSDWTLRPLFAN